MLFLLITTVLGSISPADYIYDANRPKIAAHRGLCSVFPENTLQSFEGAMFLGTDFIELDVVLNKDLELIVAHDTYLSVVSNIKDLPQFQSKYTKRTINGKARSDWWMLDFTLEELNDIKIKQVRGATRPTMFNGLFTYPTLKQVLTSVRDFNNRTGNARNPSSKPVGILLEIKDYEFHLQYTGLSIVEMVIQELQNFGLGTIKDCKSTVPIVLMSFDMNAVKAARELTDLPRVFLLMDLQSQPASFYAEATKYANIIGADLASVWDPETQSVQPEVRYIRDNQMMVYAWTFQDDSFVTQAIFNSTTSIGIYNRALTMNLQGLITEFPDAAIAYAQRVNYIINQ